MCVCACVFMCLQERERKREYALSTSHASNGIDLYVRAGLCVYESARVRECVCVCLCVCVCVRERETTSFRIFATQSP